MVPFTSQVDAAVHQYQVQRPVQKLDGRKHELHDLEASARQKVEEELSEWNDKAAEMIAETREAAMQKLQEDKGLQSNVACVHKGGTLLSWFSYVCNYDNTSPFCRNWGEITPSFLYISQYLLTGLLKRWL
ncbi:hypothetical protein Ancab_036460 [Ancistrocladus abbreviatus]